MIDFHYYLITNRHQCVSDSLAAHVEKACQAGVRAVQLREKDLSARELYNVARDLREITAKYGASLFINDRADVALAVGADGVHCRENSMSAAELKSLNSELIVGASVHSLRSAKDAEAEGADFLLFGPVFATPSKLKFGKPQGLVALQEFVHYTKVPVIAVGGIDPGNAEKCMEYGAFGVAGISSIMKADDVEKKVQEFKKSLSML